MTEWRYIKKNISQADIAVFEKLVNINLPADLCTFILEHNNGRPKPNQFDTVKTKGRLLDKLLSFNSNDTENVFKTRETLGEQIPSELIVLAMDPFGNYICLDKSSLNIIFWVHEDGSQEETGKQWRAWLDSLY